MAMLEMEVFKQDLNAVRRMIDEAGESLHIENLREQFVEYQEDTVRRLYFTVVAKPVERKQAAEATVASHGNDEPQKKAPVKAEKKVGRNDPCPCGSGKKYKNCCGKSAT